MLIFHTTCIWHLKSQSSEVHRKRLYSHHQACTGSDHVEKTYNSFFLINSKNLLK